VETPGGGRKKITSTPFFMPRKKMTAQHGGFRKGAGRPKGSRNQATIAREKRQREALEAARAANANLSAIDGLRLSAGLLPFPAHHAVHDRGADHFADQPPWHRVGIAIDLDRTIALHTPNQLARSLEWRHSGNRFEDLRLGAPEPLDWRPPGRAMQAHIGDIPRPSLKMRLEGFPARQATACARVFP
jgi:hypothetical protein